MPTTMKYGEGRLSLSVPSGLEARHVAFASSSSERHPAAEVVPGAVAELRAAGFVEAVRDRRLGVLVADGTREPTQLSFLPGVADALREAARLEVFVATGTHDPELPENRSLAERLRTRLGELGLEARLHVHDARAAGLVECGTTRRGTPLLVHPALSECDAFLVLANSKNHYFAGYSNPVKYFVPGVAGLETARANHSLTFEETSTFGRHPWHPRPERRENPLAEDMVDGFGRVIGGRPCFALVAVGSSGHWVWAGGGEVREVSGRAFETVDREATLVLESTRFLVVSPGGHPHDESLYTAQRALELSRAAVRDGGEVLFLARCANGVGSEAARRNFVEPLTRPLDEVCRRPPGPYVMYSHKSYKFGLYLRSLAAVHMTSELPPELVEAMHLAPAGDPQAVLDGWGERAAPGDAVTLLDDASRFAVYGRDEVPV